jgi:glycine/D-amino acid oxidase-like deaminating enzyme
MAAEQLSVERLARGGKPAGVAEFRNSPVWWEAAPPRVEIRRQPASVDVAIVGSGFTGLSAALTLLRHGRTVAVFDRDAPGFGASTRNGGQIGSGNQKFRVKRLIELRGEAKATALLKEGVAMLDYIAHLIESEGIDCRFQRSGRFRGAMRPEHYEAMARDMDDLRRVVGVEAYAVPRSEQHKEIGSDLFHGGSVLPGDAGLHPGLYHRGLMQRVEQLGGSVIAMTPVAAIAPEGDGFNLETSQGPVRARHVIVATNGYTRHLERYFDRRMTPVGSAVIATEPLPEALLDELMPTRRMYGNTNRAFSYFRHIPEENRIVWGGRKARLLDQSSPAAYSHLAKDLLRTFPKLAPFKITHGWSGQIGYTFDELPHLGKTPAGIHFAMGYCGTGVSRSTYFGHKIALQILGDAEGRTAFDDISFPSHPFQFVAPQMVPVFETWYRIRDAAGI